LSDVGRRRSMVPGSRRAQTVETRSLSISAPLTSVPAWRAMRLVSGAQEDPGCSSTQTDENRRGKFR
jgi:hypothetical protein